MSQRERRVRAAASPEGQAREPRARGGGGGAVCACRAGSVWLLVLVRSKIEIRNSSEIGFIGECAQVFRTSPNETPLFYSVLPCFETLTQPSPWLSLSIGRLFLPWTSLDDKSAPRGRAGVHLLGPALPGIACCLLGGPWESNTPPPAPPSQGPEGMGNN